MYWLKEQKKKWLLIIRLQLWIFDLGIGIWEFGTYYSQEICHHDGFYFDWDSLFQLTKFRFVLSLANEGAEIVLDHKLHPFEYIQGVHLHGWSDKQETKNWKTRRNQIICNALWRTKIPSLYPFAIRIYHFQQSLVCINTVGQ